MVGRPSLLGPGAVGRLFLAATAEASLGAGPEGMLHSMSGLEVESRGHAVRVRVRVSPRASRDRIGGVHAGALKVKLTAPPVDGAANAALIALFAKRLGVPKRAVTLLSGHSGRDKHLEIEGVSAEAVEALA